MDNVEQPLRFVKFAIKHKDKLGPKEQNKGKLFIAAEHCRLADAILLVYKHIYSFDVQTADYTTYGGLVWEVGSDLVLDINDYYLGNK